MRSVEKKVAPHNSAVWVALHEVDGMQTETIKRVLNVVRGSQQSGNVGQQERKMDAFHDERLRFVSLLRIGAEFGFDSLDRRKV